MVVMLKVAKNINLVIFFLGIVLFSFPSYAVQNFHGDYKLSLLSRGPELKTLELAGLKMEATKEALEECFTQNTVCVLKNTFVSYTYDQPRSGYYEVTAHAYVQPLDSFQSRSDMAMSPTATESYYAVERAFSFSNLEVRGLAFLTIEKAQSQCHAKGFVFCAFLHLPRTGKQFQRSFGKGWFAEARVSLRGYFFETSH